MCDQDQPITATQAHAPPPPTAPTEPAAADPTDKQLLERAQEGDQDAIGMLFSRYGGPVFSYCYGRLRNRADAEDAAQKTWEQFLSQLQRIEIKTNFWAYLRKIAHFTAINIRGRGKQRKNERQVADDAFLERASNQEGPADQIEQREKAAVIRQLVEDLPPGQREVVRLTWFEGHTNEEAAQRLGILPSTAKDRRKRARAQVLQGVLNYLGGAEQ